MDKTIAMIGLDTSHTVAFTRLIQGPHPGERAVHGLRVVKALRFPSVFQSEEGQNQRQSAMESMGVVMAENIEEALEDVDAVFLEINDPALHVPYYEAVAGRGRPVFIDKPLAADVAGGRRICALARKTQTPTWSASSLRFIPALARARSAVAAPVAVQTFGALGHAAAGSDLIWYGVHAVEMLVAALGTGACAVRAVSGARGTVLMLEYPDERHGLVECLPGLYRYGGRLQSKDRVAFFDSGSGSPYPKLMNALRRFVFDGIVPVPLKESLEILDVLESAERSLTENRTVPLRGSENNA